MKTLLCFLSFCYIQITFGQTQNDIERSKKELNNNLNLQFDYILDQGADYLTDSIPFEVIKKRYLIAFKEHLLDSLHQYKQSIQQAEKALLLLSEKEIENSKNQISSLISDRKEGKGNNQSISLIGLKVHTQSFLWFFWLFFITATTALTYFIKKHLSTASIQKKLLREKELAQDELSNFVKKSLSREQKLSRQILDLEKRLPPTASDKKSDTQERKKNKSDFQTE